MLFRKVPKGTNWFYTLGSATLFAFVVQALTGVFLAMYYTPSPTEAYESVTHLTNDVFLGEFVRGMHKWGATVMIILIFLHMGRAFFFGAYKYPRELNWVIGVVLLILTLVMGLTGYLLPFDQRSYWATVVANNITATGPVVGPYLADFLRAGPEVGATTIQRFYAIHMLLVPGLIIALIGAHLYLVVKLGTTAPPWLKGEKPKSLRRANRGRMNRAGEGGVPPGYEVAEEEGQALLPLRGAEGLGDGADRRPRDRGDVDRARRRAGPEGRPDHDHLRAAARVVLLLPLRAAAGDQAAGAGRRRDDRHPDDLHGPAAAAAVLRPQPRAPARAPADRDHGGHPDDHRDGLPDLPRRQRPARRPRSTWRSPPTLEPGKQVAAQSGCLACHKIGENGNDGPGPELTEIGNRLPREAIARSLEVGPGIMPSYQNLPPKKFDDLTAFLASLN